ncbi:hypothetical protein DW228_06280 [Bacteroides fragilis]|uniref:Uncharacterized protein n=1 Tax=Bacteroides fragilis TaxID=817 RepID=A0A396C6R9_BACFG|nr:hypothetical protein [Bacteroides fragilis]RHH14404.1 hypothetical protein DW228_06280 [Bacteroides fragilis]
MNDKSMKIQRSSGYMFNNTNKQLEKYEFISCRFNFAKDSVQYKCRLGGVETTVEDTNLRVYASESDYKKNISLEHYNLNFNEAMKRTYGFSPQWDGEERPKAWEYKDGDAVLIDIFDITFTIIGKYKFEKDSNRQIYVSHSQVFDFHDLVIKEADGSIKIQKSPASRMVFNDEQKALVEEFISVLQKLNAAEVKVLLDEGCPKLYVMPMTNIQTLDPWDNGNGPYTQIQDMIMGIDYTDIFTFNSEDYGLLATFKEEGNG